MSLKQTRNSTMQDNSRLREPCRDGGHGPPNGAARGGRGDAGRLRARHLERSKDIGAHSELIGAPRRSGREDKLALSGVPDRMRQTAAVQWQPPSTRCHKSKPGNGSPLAVAPLLDLGDQSTNWCLKHIVAAHQTAQGAFGRAACETESIVTSR